MSHLILENDVVFTPAKSKHSDTWHKLHTHPVESPEIILADGSNIEEALYPIRECGLIPDFPQDSDADEAAVTEMLQNHKLVYADCDGKFYPLHVPKTGYKIHQNRDLFASIVGACIEVLGEGGFEIATVGTLGGYSQFFVSISIKGQESFTIGKKDNHELFFNLNSSHNGLIGSSLLLSIVRMVCMNTVLAAIQDAENAGTKASIKHTVNSEEFVTAKAFEAHLVRWTKDIADHKAALEAMQAVAMTPDQFRFFAAGVFSDEKSDCLSTRNFNRINQPDGGLLDLFKRGRGNAGKSLYDGYNAFTEHFTSGDGAGKRDKASASKRFASANYGSANNWKLEALRVASSEEETATALKRGEILWNDKVDNLSKTGKLMTISN